MPTDTWMGQLFVAECQLRCNNATDAKQTLMNLHDSYFSHCPYILARLANAYKECKRKLRTNCAQILLLESDDALLCYQQINETHPFRLDDHDSYSSELFIQVT